MTEMSLGRAISSLARSRPDVVALTEAQGASMTWDELDRRSNAWARVLIARGVATNDVVTYGLPSGIEFVILTVAVWKAGATPQPLDPDIDGDTLTAILEQCRPTAVLGFPSWAPGIDLDIEALSSADVPDRPVEDQWAASWKAPASSGSTGRPKVVFSATPARIDPTMSTAPYIPHDAVQLVPAPLHHAAQFLFAMRGLLLGHRLVLMHRFEPATVLRLVAEHAVTWMLLNPSAMQRIWRLGEAARDASDLSSLVGVLHVGAPCPPELKSAWLGWLGAERVDEIYSGTESIGVTHISGRDWLAHPGSVGRPAQGCELRVLDHDGRALAPRTVGRVFLRPRGGAGSTYRYGGGHPGEVVDGHETLGDLGWVDDEGYLYLLDRAADVISTADGDVYPAQVEAVLTAHPDVSTCVVFGRGPRGRQQVYAVVHNDNGTMPSTTTGRVLIDWVADRMLPVAVPVDVGIVHEPVRDDFGKARRARLAQL